MARKPYKKLPISIRFWSKVKVLPNCWEWQGGLSPKGYGFFHWSGGKNWNKAVSAHRTTYG